MTSTLLDWLQLALRWAHLVLGAAWIGTSFYFNWLNHTLRPPDEPRPGVGGELWAIHGGGFYQVTKYVVAPARLPTTLHWFKWEAYLTWVTGMCLLSLVYYLNADVYLVDRGVRDIPGLVAVGAGLGTIAVGWIVYDVLCRALGKQPVALAVVGFALVTALAFAMTRLFGSRGAYMHVGATLGTIMAANVFFHIIPKQHLTVDAMTAGKEPDPAWGKLAAQRSLHNNYLTLPVLFVMVSNHYPITFGHEFNWAILAAISVIGAGTRHWFNLQGRGEKNVWILPAAAVAMLGLAFVTAPRPSPYANTPVAFDRVRGIIETRCLPCHSRTPTHPLYVAAGAPQGLMLDTREQIVERAARINSLAVVTKTMPLGNMTGMTDDERAIVGAWFAQGGKPQ